MTGRKSKPDRKRDNRLAERALTTRASTEGDQEQVAGEEQQRRRPARRLQYRLDETDTTGTGAGGRLGEQQTRLPEQRGYPDRQQSKMNGRMGTPGRGEATPRRLPTQRDGEGEVTATGRQRGRQRKRLGEPEVIATVVGRVEAKATGRNKGNSMGGLLSGTIKTTRRRRSGVGEVRHKKAIGGSCQGDGPRSRASTEATRGQ